MGNLIMNINSILVIVVLFIWITYKIISNKIDSESYKKANEMFSNWKDNILSNITKSHSDEIERLKISLNSNIEEFKKNLIIETDNKKDELEKKYQSLMNKFKNDHVYNLEQIKVREEGLKIREQSLEDKITFQNKLFEEKTIGFPWVAEMYATYKVAKYEELAKFLTSKERPAYSSAELVRAAKKAAKESERKYFIAKGLLAYYESLFPTLVEMQDAPDEDISQADETVNENFDPAQNYLDKDEWASLPKTVKFQHALDRYWDKKKSKLQIGRLYERFIGYEYEQNGWDVTYFGAIKGFEDMGRDLLIKKGNQTGIVQCKNWSAEKTIHEKHIFQLFGTTVLFSLDNKKNNRITSLPLFEDFEEKTKGIFVTSCSLSDTAKKCAKVLGIDVIENKKLERFPCIKCNIGKDGERIYHLPFDQQYDRVKIANKAGAFYCETVVEAEEAGFRRAFRWHGNS